MPWSSQVIRLPLRLRHQQHEGLADEVESANHLGSTRFEDSLAPHPSVLARATCDGIHGPRWWFSELLLILG